MQTHLPILFPATRNDHPFLCNRDIFASNILVSPTGSLVSICDWECVAALPMF
jgi:hypothetical protein